ncbi:MAPEG family protein [Oceaniovalibus sp. ACAM 378]|uniref:MAPEG family protein n=1 Tax=Oceaniovalibus sp. ACAM 378 TaxID=2599923 RepID=UPI0011D78022|nr:MAPEG family protein [Oceaniovalibus sp. ACAM 378]TYB90216.1 MAPEG family protein [Oceaniovalibus sp. ACAM 378]
MTHELTILTLAALLQVVQFALYSVAAQRQVGSKAAMGPRDRMVELTGTAGRLQRAMNNHFEGLILFTIAVVVVTTGDQSSTLTQSCATLYLIARVLYIPAYVWGLAPWRSVIWSVGLLATVVMLIAALV